MGPQLVVCSRITATDFKCDEPWACISISNSVGDWPDIDDDCRVDILQLVFVDVVFSVSQDFDYSVFSERTALEILDFVEELWWEIEVLMIHCDAGISRSSAVAAAISKLYLDDDSEFYDEDLYDPNPLVYDILLRVGRMRQNQD